MDMLISLYRINIRSKKYYIKIIFHLIDLSIVNAWLLYRRHCHQSRVPKKDILSLLQFCVEVAEALLRTAVPKPPEQSIEKATDLHLFHFHHLTFDLTDSIIGQYQRIKVAVVILGAIVVLQYYAQSANYVYVLMLKITVLKLIMNEILVLPPLFFILSVIVLNFLCRTIDSLCDFLFTVILAIIGE